MVIKHCLMSKPRTYSYIVDIVLMYQVVIYLVVTLLGILLVKISVRLHSCITLTLKCDLLIN